MDFHQALRLCRDHPALLRLLGLVVIAGLGISGILPPPCGLSTTYVGMPRPLGVGATGLAMLGALPGHEIDDYIRKNRQRLLEHHVRPESLPAQLTGSAAAIVGAAGCGSVSRRLRSDRT